MPRFRRGDRVIVRLTAKYHVNEADDEPLVEHPARFVAYAEGEWAEVLLDEPHTKPPNGPPIRTLIAPVTAIDAAPPAAA